MSAEEYLRAAGRLEADEGLDRWTALMRVLLVRLQDLVVPAELRPAMALAERHWAGDPGDLEGAQLTVWRYIQEIGPSGTDVATPEGRVARALLCVLMPGGDEEVRFMTAEWFTAMADDQEAAG